MRIFPEKKATFAQFFFHQIKSGRDLDPVTIKDMQTPPPPPLTSGQHFKNDNTFYKWSILSSYGLKVIENWGHFEYKFQNF